MQLERHLGKVIPGKEELASNPEEWCQKLARLTKFTGWKGVANNILGADWQDPSQPKASTMDDIVVMVFEKLYKAVAEPKRDSSRAGPSGPAAPAPAS